MAFAKKQLRILSLLCAMVLCIVGAVRNGYAADNSKLALLIGNQAYKGDVTRLENPIRDINLITDSLEKDGFHVDQLRDANRSQMMHAIREFASKLYVSGAGSVGVLYYSGHGMASAGAQSENYLIPTSVDKLDYPEIWEDSVRVQEIENILKTTAPYNRVFLVVDACRDELRISTKAMIVKTFAEIAGADGLFVAFSTGWGHTATDWPGHENSPYAKTLAQLLLIPGINHRELFHRVAERVKELTLDVQRPVQVDLMGGDFFFAGDPAPKAANDEKFNQPQSSASYAEGVWDLIKDGTDPALFERFSLNFADTPHADEARAKATSLRANKASPSAQASKSESVTVPSKIDVRSKWPSYRKGDQVTLYVKTEQTDKVSVKALFKLGTVEHQEAAKYDSAAKAYVIDYSVPANTLAGSYKVPIILEDGNSGRQEKVDINVEIGLSRSEWTATYLQPGPGQPALIPAETNSVVVASPEDSAAASTLRRLCSKFSDVNFAMYTSVRRDQSNARYQIEMAYNLSYDTALYLKAYASQRGIAKDPYILTYKWPSHAETYSDCFAIKPLRYPQSFSVPIPGGYRYQ
jgi:hypothetical protein